jgi:hypothetical protein
MDKERFDKGLAVRKEVLGAEYVDKALAQADDFSKPFQELLTEYCWGACWGSDALTRQQRDGCQQQAVSVSAWKGRNVRPPMRRREGRRMPAPKKQNAKPRPFSMTRTNANRGSSRE